MQVLFKIHKKEDADQVTKEEMNLSVEFLTK